MSSRSEPESPAVFELTFALRAREAERLSAALFEAGAGAVEERAGPALVVYLTDAAEIARYSRLARATVQGPLEITERELDPSWRTEWMRHLGPEAITERVVFQPLGNDERLLRGKRRLWFEPDQAFGVGSHATTRLAARAVERIARARRPRSVLDVGTGSGVLAMLAAISGAQRVLGIDVDPIAVKAARRNARHNHLTSRCSFSGRTLAQVRSRFELVAANIETWVLLELAPDLARVTAPGGRLVLSGVLAERGDEMAAAFAERGLSERAREVEDGWIGLELCPSAALSDDVDGPAARHRVESQLPARTRRSRS
ncbi:MAG: 50S ribosomal protein L11 methyltransferase [Myxococcales bacterium]|nr:50S ribosomal protein L11 methyltransferase [Myxococcales bacterium]